jgi:hypothetical protein
LAEARKKAAELMKDKETEEVILGLSGRVDRRNLTSGVE